tara:strand:+ start:151 stop:639 length:489 start_codon:yes stop_codon:yes gene_type:complete
MNNQKEHTMKKPLLVFLIIIIILPANVLAGDKEEIVKQITENNEYLKKNKRSLNDYSSEGALEFWSSGGLMQEIKPSGRPESFDSYNLTFKHIEVIILVPGKAAVAMYYSEGSMKPKGLPSVSHYMTRVTQAFVKEGDGWRIRATHWSPLTGGSGTSQANTN